MPVTSFPPISDYGLIGDTRSAALVNRAGGIDWLCWPRFDSGAIFCAILDRELGGRCELVAADGSTLVPVGRRYRPGTLVLETTIAQRDARGTELGRLTIVDAMPVQHRACCDTDHPQSPADDVDLAADGRLIREVRRDSGTIDAAIVVWPTFDFATAPTVSAKPDGDGRVVILGGGVTLVVEASSPVELDAARGAATLRLRLGAGERAWLALAHDLNAPHVDDAWVTRMLAETTDYWQRWTGRDTYPGPRRAAIERSLLTLKAMTHSPTGGIVAAPTLGLPEVIGGPRNYDYRYSWVRDSGFTVRALLACGHRREARAYLRFLVNADIDRGRGLTVLMTLDGKRPDDAERELSHLSGYRDSRPIRVGNLAVAQQQHDVWGEALAALHAYWELTGDLPPDGEHRRDHFASVVTNLAECVTESWRKPDRGIWERRDEPRHYVHSKAMCWLALDRAAKLAPALGLAHRAPEWATLAQTIRSEYLALGWNPRLNAYAAWYDPAASAGTDAPLDASVLRAGLLGAFDFADPRFVSTIDAVRVHLSARDVGEPDLIYRYRDPDAIAGKEGTFTSCGFWVAACLALAGRRDEADALADRLLARGNDLGLFAEEIDPRTGEQLGNVPQAFTHVAIVSGAARVFSPRRHGVTEKMSED